jgi:hypothetical protein
LYKNFNFLKFLHNFKDKKLKFKVKTQFYKNRLKTRLILYKVFINLYLIKSLKQFLLNYKFNIIKNNFIFYQISIQQNILISKVFNLPLVISQYLIEEFYFLNLNKNFYKIVLLNILIFLPFIFQSLVYLYRLYKFFVFGSYIKLTKYLKRRYFFLKKYKKYRYKKIYNYKFRINRYKKLKKKFNLVKLFTVKFNLKFI